MALELAATGDIAPIIDTVIGFDSAAHAHRQIERRNAHGMFVMTP
ncbi:hypothetical protein [Rhodococcus kronopolitis]|uniref:Zinc-binding dehydrogenase n=1 Tax=Rhodococcus kronopolitis TaxID=1460226 RepID=A0ABV9FUU3_9NOCA